MDLIRENMETEQWISAKPTQTAVETEVALPGGLYGGLRDIYAYCKRKLGKGDSGSEVSKNAENG